MSDNEITSTRVITVRLRIPALVLLAVLLVGGLIWAFVLGVMVGRGQINDELAALMPPAQSAPESAAGQSADEVESLIKAEDLKYQESLRQNQATADPAALAEAARNDSAPARPAGQSTSPATSPATPPASPVAGTPSTTPAAPAQETQKPAQAAQEFDYIFQVASFTKEAQALDLQARLLARRIDAQLETKTINGTARYRVLVSFRGDESRVKSMQDLLKKDFKINSILPRGKTPAGRRA